MRARAEFARYMGGPALMAAMSIGAPSAQAQTAEPTIQSRTAEIQAQAELERARAERDRAAADRITALGLPSFEGKTTLGAGVGSMEATMLASHAVHRAAMEISRASRAAAPNRPFIVLAGDEALDFGRVGAIGAELDAIHVHFERLTARPQSSEAGGFVGASAAISAITAAAGLFRSDTEVTALDLQALSSRVLAMAVASRLGKLAIMPTAAIGALPPDGPVPADWSKRSLIQKLNGLALKRNEVAAAMPTPADPKNPTAAEKAAIADFTAALARFDTFFARVTTADDKGAVPIVQAARLDQIWRRGPSVLRVHVEKAGGSLIKNTNILTTLALDDPIRITGGLVASYLLTDPATGDVIASDLLSCSTTVSRLRPVQRGYWRRGAGAGDGAACSGLGGSSMGGGR